MKGRKSSSRYWIKANIARSAPAARRNIAVRLICATTEPVSSSFYVPSSGVSSGYRIDLPCGIRQRSVEEQIELIIGFLQRESRKIERTVSIDKTLLLWLLNKPLEAISASSKAISSFCAPGHGPRGWRPITEVLLLDSKLADGPINATRSSDSWSMHCLTAVLLNIDARTLPRS